MDNSLLIDILLVEDNPQESELTIRSCDRSQQLHGKVGGSHAFLDVRRHFPRLLDGFLAIHSHQGIIAQRHQEGFHEPQVAVSIISNQYDRLFCHVFSRLLKHP